MFFVLNYIFSLFAITMCVLWYIKTNEKLGSKRNLFIIKIVASVCTGFSIILIANSILLNREKIDINEYESTKVEWSAYTVKSDNYYPRRKFIEGRYTREELDTLEADYERWADHRDSIKHIVDSCCNIHIHIDTALLTYPHLKANIDSEVPFLINDYYNHITKYNCHIDTLQSKKHDYYVKEAIQDNCLTPLNLFCVSIAIILQISIAYIEYLTKDIIILKDKPKEERIKPKKKKRRKRK